MYKYILILSFLLPNQLSFCQQFTVEIKTLIENEKYQSAWILIDQLYPNKNTDNVILKTDFCLRYFSQTKFHQNFNFNNIDSSNSLLDFRKISPTSETNFNDFNPEKSLLDSRTKEPNNFKINLALGNYYYEVFITYKNEWIKPKPEVEALYYYHFNEAYLHNVKSELSVFALGVYFMGKQNPDLAKELLNEGLKMNPKYAAAHYNLAYLNIQLDSTELAISHAQKAFDLYPTKELKADAASMTGILLMDQKKYEDAINWLLTSDALLPGNFFVYESLLKCYLHLNKLPEADLIAKNLYYFDWKNAKIFNTLQENYIENGKQKELFSFLQERLKERINDKEYQGFVYIYLTQFSALQNDAIAAKEYIDEATKCFTICYDKEHAIFKALENLKKNI